MRAFLGIPLPTLDPLERLLGDLRGCGADLKVVDGKNLHLTLKFLGEIPDAQAAPILAGLHAAAFPSTYPIRVRDVGAFPDWRKLNICWVGLEDRDGKLSASFALSERLLVGLGFPPETRPFAPHITIARKRSDRGREEAARILSPYRGAVFGEVTLEGPHLYRSTLTPQGPVYESLGSVTA